MCFFFSFYKKTKTFDLNFSLLFDFPKTEKPKKTFLFFFFSFAACRRCLHRNHKKITPSFFFSVISKETEKQFFVLSTDFSKPKKKDTTNFFIFRFLPGNSKKKFQSLLFSFFIYLFPKAGITVYSKNPKKTKSQKEQKLFFC